MALRTAIPVRNCSAIESGDWTVMAGKSGLACVLAGEKAATVRTAPAKAGTAVEMWRARCTSYNTVCREISPQRPLSFFEVEGKPHGVTFP